MKKILQLVLMLMSLIHATSASNYTSKVIAYGATHLWQMANGNDGIGSLNYTNNGGSFTTAPTVSPQGSYYYPTQTGTATGLSGYLNTFRRAFR
jgi:hypothetical protein